MTQPLLTSLELLVPLLLIALFLLTWVRSFAYECLKIGEDQNIIHLSTKRSLSDQRVSYRS